MTSPQTTDVLVIGAGIAGLSCAYRLKQAGLNVLIVEKSNRVGGSLDSRIYKSANGEEIIYEYGPNTIMNSHKHLMKLIVDLGLETELITTEFAKSKRYLYKDSRLMEVSPLSLIFSSLLSWKAKLRILGEPWCPKFERGDETVFDFMQRKFGSEVAEIAASFLRGVWGADSHRLSSAAALPKLVAMEAEHGSILRALLMTKRQCRTEPLATVSFKSGMSTLTNALADKIGRENIIYGVNPNDYRATVTVLATKASEAAELLSGADSLHLDRDWALDLSWLVRQVNYAAIFLLTLSLPRKRLRKTLTGFGFLSHINSGLATLGTIWGSELFSARQLNDEYLFTSYLSPLIDADLDTLRSQAIAEQIQVLQEYAGSELSAADFTVVDSKYIADAIPQYELGAPELLESLERKLKTQNKLFLVGNYLHGISLEDVLKQSERVAKQVESLLSSKTPVLQ